MAYPEIFAIPTANQTASNPSPETAGASKNRSLELALAAARVAGENRGRDIVILDLREVTPVFDYFVIATGGSRRQLHAICEEIDQTLEVGMRDHRLGREGFEASRWILLDYGNVVVHLFDDETRKYYDLENLWGAGKRVPVPAVELRETRAAAGQ